MGRPMPSADEQVAHLKEKGVTFNLFSEHDAAEYLRSNNYYFKLSAYRRNYDKREGGPRSGQYIDLDFAYLRDLAIIDMTLRYTLVQLSLDIEHYVKLDLRYLLIPCKSIWNAAAHNSCILNDLRPGTASHPVRRSVLEDLNSIGVSAQVRKNRLKNDRIRQIVSLLYVYKHIVTSKGMVTKASGLLHKLIARAKKHFEYYDSNDMIRSNFLFLEIIISKWFPE